MMARKELATRNQEVPMTLIEETNPQSILEDAVTISNVLKDIIDKQKLFALYKGGKKHVVVEGWTTLGALSKVFAHVEYTKRLDREGEIAYEAQAVAKTLQGVTISRVEALCSDKETLRRKDGKIIQRWTDEHSVKSMAQTRAISKCLRYPLGWIMTLAGYEVTPSEEMPPELAYEPIKTQKDGTEILPPKPKTSKKVVNSKPKMQEFKGQGKPVPEKNLKKVFEISKDLKEKFEPVHEQGEDVPIMLLLRETEKLLDIDKISMDDFRKIKALIL